MNKVIVDYEVPFTQYLRPFGQKEEIKIQMELDVCTKAQKILDAGYVFEAEVLSIGNMVSFTIGGYDPKIEEDSDCAMELVQNGPGVPAVVKRLIMDFNLDFFKGRPVT